MGKAKRTIIESYKDLLEKTGTITGSEAEDLAKEIASVEEGIVAAMKRDKFFSNPDGHFFIVESHGFVIPFGSWEQGLPPEADVQVSLAAPKTLNNTYAIVEFSRQTTAEVFKAKSIFVAQAKAEERALLRGSVSLAIKVGTFAGDTALFRSLAFIDYVILPEKQVKPSTTTVQTLIFDKEKFTVAQAKAWAKENGFRSDKVDEPEAGKTIRLRQKSPSAFQPGSFRTISLKSGIKAVVGRPNKKAKKSDLSRLDRMEAVLEKIVADLDIDTDKGDMETAKGDGEGGEQDPGEEIPEPDTDGDEDEEITFDDEEETEAEIDEDDPVDETDLEDTEDPEAVTAGDLPEELFEKEIPFVYKDAKEQMAFGIVYAPQETDAHGDFMTKAEILKMMKRFMKRYRKDRTSGIDKDHDGKARQDINIIENFIVEKNDKRFPKAAGAWAIGVHVENKKIWKQVDTGELTGFSFAGMARARAVKRAA